MDIKTLIELKPNPNIAQFAPGDTVRVSYKIVEGDKERIQAFEGVVIRIRKGAASASFTVRRTSLGVGVERTFFTHSPRLEKVEMMRQGKVRRAKLYYLRALRGKAARIKGRGLRVAVPTTEAEPMPEAAEATAAAPPAPAEGGQTPPAA